MIDQLEKVYPTLKNKNTSKKTYWNSANQTSYLRNIGKSTQKRNHTNN